MAEEKESGGLSEQLRKRLAAQRERTRELEESDSRLVDQFIAELERRGLVDKCPLCGSESWTVGGSILGVPLLRGTAVQPFFILTCDQCANTHFFPVEAFDLWPEGDPRGSE